MGSAHERRHLLLRRRTVAVAVAGPDDAALDVLVGRARRATRLPQLLTATFCDHVETHVSNILTKLGLSSRAAATAYAYEHHLL